MAQILGQGDGVPHPDPGIDGCSFVENADPLTFLVFLLNEEAAVHDAGILIDEDVHGFQRVRADDGEAVLGDVLIFQQLHPGGVLRLCKELLQGAVYGRDVGAGDQAVRDSERTVIRYLVTVIVDAVSHIVSEKGQTIGTQPRMAGIHPILMQKKLLPFKCAGEDVPLSHLQQLHILRDGALEGHVDVAVKGLGVPAGVILISGHELLHLKLDKDTAALGASAPAADAAEIKGFVQIFLRFRHPGDGADDHGVVVALVNIVGNTRADPGRKLGTAAAGQGVEVNALHRVHGLKLVNMALVKPILFISTTDSILRFIFINRPVRPHGNTGMIHVQDPRQAAGGIEQRRAHAQKQGHGRRQDHPKHRGHGLAGQSDFCIHMLTSYIFHCKVWYFYTTAAYICQCYILTFRKRLCYSRDKKKARKGRPT